ncbi:hypothetical protein AVEN_14264-1 [Araneus ventricosus]|uniref:Uncharacterized protein n=1 Tax=Araneus ventricosus TaxID=182803 RepID=A0A4Y2KDX0_ARAVE|nr:hypothetical protein AVEN_14264-1 [Araneus ventricosus]
MTQVHPNAFPISITGSSGPSARSVEFQILLYTPTSDAGLHFPMNYAKGGGRKRSSIRNVEVNPAGHKESPAARAKVRPPATIGINWSVMRYYRAGFWE